MNVITEDIPTRPLEGSSATSHSMSDPPKSATAADIRAGTVASFCTPEAEAAARAM